MRQYTILAALVCVGLLTALIYALDPAQVGAAIANVSLCHLAGAFLAVQLQVILSAWRWRFTAGRLEHDIALPTAIGEYYVSSFLNLILPGGMAGDALRAYRNRAEGAGGWKRPAAAVFLERLSGQFAFFAVAAIG
ncbi:MAG: lysylphosphatidylglycerol synthase transmembrane domain-containing protein, partial [Reinekea sp.]